MSVILDYPQAQVLYRPVSAGYVRVKDSIEYYGCDRRTYKEREGAGFDADSPALPDVWNYYPRTSGGKVNHVKLTEDIQHWLFRLCIEVYLGRMFDSEMSYRAFWSSELIRYKKDRDNGSALIAEWDQLFRWNTSHSNFAGFDTCANYIAQELLDHEPVKFFQIVTGGFVGRLADDQPANVYGKMCLPLECVNVSRGDYRQYHPFTHPHLFDAPAVTGRKMIYDDKAGWQTKYYFRQNYPHFSYGVRFPFVLPLDDTAWLPVDLLVKPSDDEPGHKQYREVAIYRKGRAKRIIARKKKKQATKKPR